MSFTTITITGGPFTPTDGKPAQGKVTPILPEAIINGDVQIERTTMYMICDETGMVQDDSGEQPFTLVADDDTGVTPTGSSYQFLIESDSALLDEFTAVVPNAAVGRTLDLQTPARMTRS